MKGKKRKRDSDESDDEALLGPIAKQRSVERAATTIKESFMLVNKAKGPLPQEHQKRVDDSILNYIIADARPLTTVDSPFF